jgi:hypothetical protein
MDLAKRTIVRERRLAVLRERRLADAERNLADAERKYEARLRSALADDQKQWLIDAQKQWSTDAIQRPWASPPAGHSEQAELEAKIAKLFDLIERQARERNAEELVPALTQLHKTLEQWDTSTDEAKKRLQQWEARMANFSDIRHAIKLQVALVNGNKLLQELTQQAKIDPRSKETGETRRKLKAFIADMRAEGDETFRRNADAYEARVQTLLEGPLQPRSP